MGKTTFSQRKEEHKLKMIYEIKQLEVFFKTTFNLDLYLIYGTLLGAIREKNFIPHDKDIDLAYFSQYTNAHQVRKEFSYICKVLKEKNLFKRARGYKHIDCGAISDKFIFDIWSSYIENNVFYLAPFKQSFNISTFIPLKETIFKNTIFKIPNNPKIFLNDFYKNWKSPIITDFRKIKY